MARKVYNKLVRDKIPEIIRAHKEEPRTRILNEAEYVEALKKKLGEEESKEVMKASREEILGELADVCEIIDALLITHGYSREDLVSLQNKKREERGGFAERIFLEYTDPKE